MERSRRYIAFVCAVLVASAPIFVSSTEAQAADVPPADFAPNVRYPVGLLPSAVDVRDLDGDERLDIVTSNTLVSSVSVLLADASGGFARTDYPTGYLPIDVVVRDMDGDQMLDIVTADEGGDTVSVLKGDGDGTFATPVSHPTGDLPYELEVRDLNGDGRLDIAISSVGLDALQVLLATPAGGFASPVTYSMPGYGRHIQVRDVDNDGVLDLASAGEGGVKVLRGVGDGTFGEWMTIATSYEVSVVEFGDLNRDGRLDMVIGDDYSWLGAHSGKVGIFYGTPAGGFSAMSEYHVGQFVYSIGIRDITGDGRPDIVAGVGGTASNAVLTSKSTGGFNTALWFPGTSYTRSMALNDVTGDGRLDIVFPDPDAPFVVVSARR